MEINGVEKLVPNLRDKKNYAIHIQALNQALQHGLRLDGIHQVIEFDQSPWLKTYIDFNTQLRTAATNNFEKDFFKLMNNSVFGKMMENIRKHKLVTTEEKYLPTVMHPNIKTEDIYEDIANNVEARFDTSGYSKTDFRPLPIGLNKKAIGLMKDESGGKIMTKFVALRPKLYSYKKLDGSEDKKWKGIKKCIVKKTLTFEDYKKCLFNDSTEYRSQVMFRSAKHEVHTIEVNKVTLNRDDDKRISRKDEISTFAIGHKDLSWSPLLGVLSLI